LDKVKEVFFTCNSWYIYEIEDGGWQTEMGSFHNLTGNIKVSIGLHDSSEIPTARPTPIFSGSIFKMESMITMCGVSWSEKSNMTASTGSK